MKRKGAIRRLLIMSAWFVVICGLATLLIAANRKEREHVCKDVLIGIKNESETFYIHREEILSEIKRIAKSSLNNQPVTSFNLVKLEKAIEANPWIFKAELYFDNKDYLHALIEERTPVARIFTRNGRSFYMDSSGQKMPLLEKISARVPVVTGYTDNNILNEKDSSLLNQVKHIAYYIYNNEFWNAQIGQVEITENAKFELVPVIGDHIIILGTADKIEEKLNNLFVFYKRVMTKVGFNKYAALNLEYDAQVVAIKKGPASAIDSIQLKKNIEDLMNKTNLQNSDKEMLPQESAGKADLLRTIDSDYTKNNNRDSVNSKITKEANKSKSIETGQINNTINTDKKPKALMKKLNSGNG